MSVRLRFEGCCHVPVAGETTCHVCAVIDQPARPEREQPLDAVGWHTGTVIDHDDLDLGGGA